MKDIFFFSLGTAGGGQTKKSCFYVLLMFFFNGFLQALQGLIGFAY